MHKARGLFLTAAACALLFGCGNKTPTGQVVATIKGKEVTSAELNNELNGFSAPNPEVRKAAEQQALNSILARKILARSAEKAGVGKTPAFALQERRMHETLLVQTWQAQIAKTVPAPSPEEVDKFVTDHPDLYASRKVFVVEQIRFPRPSDPALIQAFQPLKTIQDIAALLAERKIPYQLGQGQIDALQVGPDAVAQIEKLPPGEVFLVPQGNLLVGNHITETRVVPLASDQSSKQAAAYLKQKRTQEALQRQFGGILAGAKKDVVYAKAYQPVTPTKAGAAAVASPAAAGAPAPKAP